MSVTIKFDSVDFRREFRARVLRSRRTLAEVTNEITFQILRSWQKLIPKGDRAAIEALGITYRTHNKRGTKLLKRRKAIYAPTTAFKLISLKSMWQRGPSPRSYPDAAALEDAIARRLARRSSSVGFVSSGPVPGMRALIRKIHGQNLTAAEVRRFKGTKGGAIPAVDSWSPFAEVENATGLNGPGQTEVSKDRVQQMLISTWGAALAAVTQDMASHAAKRLEDALHDRK